MTEFMIYMRDPEAGQETDLIYGSLGNYRQPVSAYHATFPPSVFNFPLILILSWAKAIPMEPAKANLTLLGDVGSYLSTSGESLFAIPIASTEKVGSVKIGDSLKITEDSTLSVNAASEEEINAMFSEVLNPDNK